MPWVLNVAVVPLKDLGKVMSAPQVKMLKAELEMKAKATHSARFWAQEVKA